MNIKMDITAGTTEQARQLMNELWEHIDNDCISLPFKIEYNWGTLTYVVKSNDTESELVDLIERFIEDEQNHGYNWSAQLIQEKLNKILERR